MRASGRARLPTCVLKIRSVLRFIALSSKHLASVYQADRRDVKRVATSLGAVPARAR
jgi:hypothetical protein